ncbi:hypothetical protein [Anabaena catenula]|uniref:Phosphodiester glycosidase domain-containing protein n=1 Tax=Anabaena catenula FACHB-362 TaxID=2692877 RepID=A0ABR8J192_9NOST|nr:hypothetical protein [Anabaena catenula]MBD2691620.1 hypothetical protein [Anabaena catenula FACHB-362]
MLNKIIFLILLSSILLISNLSTSQAFKPLSDYQPLQVINGAGLYEKNLANGNKAYLQVIDLSKMHIDQLTGEVDNMGLGQGKYYKGEGGYYSPFFQNKLFSQVSQEYKKLYNNDVFSLINCSFFEQYQSSTQLSFPIKLNGTVISGGTSPYGPIREPKDKFYSKVRLKALVWDDEQAYITDYNPVNGAPLNQKRVQNAIVSYQYSDHPAKVLAQNPANKYQVIGTLNKDSIKGDELMLIMTVNKATLDEAASLLRQLGVKGDIITVDGGTSTYLSNSQTGNIVLPQLSNSLENPTFSELPHYLGFRKKSKKQLSPHIFVSQPVTKVNIEKNEPYLLLWQDNLDGDVTIQLYDGTKLIKTISPHTASDGIYKWKPDISLKPGYIIRISSQYDRKIFGELHLE